MKSLQEALATVAKEWPQETNTQQALPVIEAFAGTDLWQEIIKSQFEAMPEHTLPVIIGNAAIQGFLIGLRTSALMTDEAVLELIEERLGEKGPGGGGAAMTNDWLWIGGLVVAGLLALTAGVKGRASGMPWSAHLLLFVLRMLRAAAEWLSAVYYAVDAGVEVWFQQRRRLELASKASAEFNHQVLEGRHGEESARVPAEIAGRV